MKKYNISQKSGGSLLDNLINKLPFELHVPGYEFCGPGTKLNKRLERGDRGINQLDSACKVHDIAYATHKSGAERRKADKVLAKEAFDRFKSPNASFGERATALAVSGIMAAKSKMGLGISKSKEKASARLKRRLISHKKKLTKEVLKEAINEAKQISNHWDRFNSLPATSRMALRAAKAVIRKRKTPKKLLAAHAPRVIPIPKKIGGMISLVPIFAGLSALGSLVGGASSIVKAVNQTYAAKRRSEIGNSMETIPLGKTTDGNGLFLKPYRTGLGLYIHKGDDYIDTGRDLKLEAVSQKN